jgi:hypothetical protein
VPGREGPVRPREHPSQSCSLPGPKVPQHHVRTVDRSSLPRWVRVPHRPFPAPTRARLSHPSRFPLSAGVWGLLLPKPAASQGAGESWALGSRKDGSGPAVRGAEDQR